MKQHKHIKKRPDPIKQQYDYNIWYYSQPEEIQLSEWQRYHNTQKNPDNSVSSKNNAPPFRRRLIENAKNNKLKIASLIQTTKNPDKTSFINIISKPFFVSISIFILLLFLNYNQLVYGQIRSYITPGSSNSSLDLIVDASEGNNSVSIEPRIILSKIGVDSPVVFDEDSFEEDKIQAALEKGVVHYGTTALPGEIGNSVLLGHSANNIFNAGEYKYAFVLLDRYNVGDTYSVHYQGTRYTYKITSKEVVEPDDFSVVQPTSTPTMTLITCTPPGTNWRRLVIKADQISPNPANARMSQQPDINLNELEDILPTNYPSLLNRIIDFIF